MKHHVRGAAVPVVVIVAAAFAVGAVAGVAGTLYFMGKKGGLGGEDGLKKETQPASVTEIVETVSEIIPEPTEPPTQPATNALYAIEVTVSGNDYIYNATVLSLDELTGILRINPELPVYISDDNASLKAYNALVSKLDELGIRHQSED